jgi:hypothetical protein
MNFGSGGGWPFLSRSHNILKLALIAVFEVLCVKNIHILRWFERIAVGEMVDIEKPVW